MNLRFHQIATIVAVTFILAGCHREAPVYNVTDSPISVSKEHTYTQEQVGKIIIKAALANGWRVKRIKPGELHATIEWRGHSAVSRILYSKTDYSIELISSKNLNQEKGKIHPKYNERVKKLQDAIDEKLSLANR